MNKEELARYIGNKIKEMRINQGKTQEELALALDTTKQSIGRYEKGLRRANQDLLFELADIFDCSINDFFPPIETMTSIESIYNQLDQPRKTKVYNFAEYQLREQNKKHQNRSISRVLVFSENLRKPSMETAGVECLLINITLDDFDQRFDR